MSFELLSILISTNKSLHLSGSISSLGFWNAMSKIRFPVQQLWWNPLVLEGLGMDTLKRITPSLTSWSTQSTHKQIEL